MICVRHNVSIGVPINPSTTCGVNPRPARKEVGRPVAAGTSMCISRVTFPGAFASVRTRSRWRLYRLKAHWRVVTKVAKLLQKLVATAAAMGAGCAVVLTMMMLTTTAVLVLLPNATTIKVPSSPDDGTFMYFGAGGFLTHEEPSAVTSFDIKFLCEGTSWM